MDNKKVGNRIKERRKELELTLKEVADIVGVASSTIQRYENGTINQYKLPVLESIAKALKVNPTWLVREDAPMNIVSQTKKTINNKKQNAIETILLTHFNKLNNEGKAEAIKRIEELTYINRYITKDNIIEIPQVKKEIWEEEGKEHLMPKASHDMDGEFSEEDYKYDDSLMKDDDLWK